MRVLWVATFVALSVFASGCVSAGNLTSIYHTPELEDGNSLVLDAEQWAILNVPRYGIDPESANTPRVVCAMPSPDALAAAAASGSLSLDNPGGTSGGGAFSVAESAASIGLRTQTIQTLRDQMYRMCEGYAAGGIDEIEYGVMMRRFQSHLAAILAIEQLTGAVVAPPVAVASSSDATVVGLLIEEQEQLDRRIEDLERRIAANPDTNIEEETRLKTDKANLERHRTVYASALTAAARGDFSRAAALRTSVSVSNSNINAQNMRDIAQAVESITLAAMSQDYSDQMCFELMRFPNDNNFALRDGYCAPMLRDSLVQRRESAATVNLLLQAIAVDGISAEELPVVEGLLGQMDRGWSSQDLRRFTPAASTVQDPG